MSIFADFSELAAAVVAYAHRDDLLDETQDYFIPLAGVRIGRELESSANEKQTELDGEALGNPMALPEDFGRIRSLYFRRAGRDYALQARDNVSITAVPEQGTDPLAYNIRDGAIYARPFVSGIYTLNYYGIPALDAQNPVNDVLLRHPQIYLYGALVELQIWTQDAAQRELALAAFNGEVERTNRAERRARANAPAGVGVI